MNMNEYKKFVDLAITEDAYFECNAFDDTNREQYQYAEYLDDEFLKEVKIDTLEEAEELIDELIELGGEYIDADEAQEHKMNTLEIINRALEAGDYVTSINYQVECDESLIFLIK